MKLNVKLTLIVALSAVFLASASFAAGGSGKEGKGGKAPTIEEARRALEESRGGKAPEGWKNTTEGGAALTEASQLVNKRNFKGDVAKASENLAEAVVKGRIKLSTLKLLIEESNQSAAKAAADALIILAEKGMLASEELMVQVDGKPVSLLNFWEINVAAAAKGDWSPKASEKLDAFSRALFEAVDSGKAKTALEAIKAACDVAKISFEEFIKACLK